MDSFDQFLESLQQAETVTLDNSQRVRMQELAGLRENKFLERYAIQILVQKSDKELLTEHEQYKKFRKTTNLYYYHPQDNNIPVKAHYHVIDHKSKKEKYAINLDGSAHHKSSKGKTIPKKEAVELRNLGVNIPTNNLIENKNVDKEPLTEDCFSFTIVIEWGEEEN